MRRYYVNKATNRSINFSYELYVLEEGIENNAENVLANFADGETVNINGLPGVLEVGNFGATVCWVDTSSSIVFTLYTDGVQPDELLKVAESVR